MGMGLDYVFDQSQIKAYVAAHPDIFPPEKGYDKGVRMVEPERIPEIVEGLLNMGWSDENVLGFRVETTFVSRKKSGSKASMHPSNDELINRNFSCLFNLF